MAQNRLQNDFNLSDQIGETITVPGDIVFSGTMTTSGTQTETGAHAFTGAVTCSGGLTVSTAALTITDVNVALSATTGTKIGTAITQKLGFFNATPVVQRAGAAQAAVATTGATNSSPYGFTTAAQADAIVTLVNEIRAALVEIGLVKGAA